MSAAMFVVCAICERLMLGKRDSRGIYPQPHKCVAPCEADE